MKIGARVTVQPVWPGRNGRSVRAADVFSRGGLDRVFPMPYDPSPISSRLDEVVKLVQQIGLELQFVDPVRENGIQGLQTLLESLATAAPSDPPKPFLAALEEARIALDDRASADSRLTADSITFLRDWHPRLVLAVSGWSVPQPKPEIVAGGHAVEHAPVQRASLDSPAVEAQAVDVSIADADPEMLQLFCAEAQDLLQDVEQGVLILESNPRDAATIDRVFRAFHTFKGNVGVMKLVVLQQLTHELESLLDAARRGKLEIGRESIDLILEGEAVLRRYVEEMLRLLGGGGSAAKLSLPIPGLIGRVHRILAGATSTPATPARPAPQPVAQSAAPPTAQPVAQPLSRPSEPPAVEAAPPPPAPSPATAAAGIVRVDTLKLDGLIDLVGELVIAQSMVVQSPEVSSIASVHLSRCLGQLRGITADLQRTAMSLRMVPIRNTFQKMARLVRDLAVQQDKAIDLLLEGEDTELDRNIVEELGDPLVHMIRNSADHGIEPRAERIAAGKPAAGRIALRAYHRGGFIVIEIQDDGRGLNPDRIRAKAIERELIKADQSLDEAEVFDLIFAPGFSTAERVTDLSGRGVGMDVVRRNIEKMRGKIEIESTVGRGTTFTISLPLTLAIIEGLLVGVGDQRYVIPTLSVRESFRPLPGSVSTVQGRGEMVAVRGRLTPVLRLGDHLRTPTKATDLTQGIVVVVESGQDSRCLFVDELIGKQEVVIKSLGEMFHQQADFAGAAILGDGRVGLILNINSLVKLKARNGDAAA